MSAVRIHKLSLRDQGLFEKYLNLSVHELSVYAFANIYIWKGFFDISWTEINQSLCVFFQDKIGSFLYLSPLSKKPDSLVVTEAFRIMDKLNANKEISRIENVEVKDLDYYRKLGFVCQEKSVDYICSRFDLAQLRGDKFKSKRANFNYFSKHYKSECSPYSAKDAKDCLKLYKLWAAQRSENSKDDLYRFLLEDSLKSLKVLLTNYQDLNCTGRLVRVDGELRGFTFGFKLNSETFCILYEITDLSIKGLAQFIFREFSRQMSDYKYINIMDDSGLENLKKVKLSYHPVKLVPAFIVKRKS